MISVGGWEGDLSESARDFEAVLRAHGIGDAPDTAPEATSDEPTAPPVPRPNMAQGTSDGSTPQLSPSDMFVDFLSTQIRGVNRDAFRGSADAAAAGQQVGWKSA